jgi:hypothetical protein
MAVDPSVRIDIAAEFTGKKAFDKAGKSTSSLEKGVKSLGKTLAVTFGARAVLNFGKSAAKAFIEDDNAARSLSITIKNLGLNYDNNAITVSRFIDNLEEQTGVLDDELRPAMDRLLRATGSVSKSQELLNLSLDIAAGTGKTVTQVSQSLQKAYLGQAAAVGRLGVGLTKAELATGDFKDIQQKLTDLFAGQAASAASSYAGQMAKLQVSANNAKETIGKGLIDALTELGTDNTIDNLNLALQDTSLYIADVIRGIGALGSKIKGIPVLGQAVSLPLDAYVQAIPVIGSYISILSNMGAELRTLNARAGRMYTGGSGGPSRDFVKEAEAKKLAALEKKRAAAQLASEKAAQISFKKALLAEKARAAFTKAQAFFDINKIQIAAALKATYDQDTRLRLLAMQALENDNGEAALKYIEQLQRLTASQQADKLNGLKGIGEVELSAINKLLLAELDAIAKSKMSEADKAAARQEAYKKYNDAIIASGGLADKNFYSEETQIDLLTISKLASLDNVAAAQATYDILNYSTQIDIIARIAKAQAAADAAKLKALQEYLGTLATAPILGGLPGIPGAPPVPTGPQPPKFGIGGQPIFPDGFNGGYGTGTGITIPPVTPAPSDNSVTIIVEGNILDGDDFTDKVNGAVLDAFRQGKSRFPAGVLPDGG